MGESHDFDIGKDIGELAGGLKSLTESVTTLQTDFLERSRELIEVRAKCDICRQDGAGNKAACDARSSNLAPLNKVVGFIAEKSVLFIVVSVIAYVLFSLAHSEFRKIYEAVMGALR